MVNNSTGAFAVDTCMGIRARSAVESYSVPHSWVFLPTTSVHASAVGREKSVYSPAGTFVEPSMASRSILNPVAALAPVRQMLLYGTTPPNIVRPRFDGRP